MRVSEPGQNKSGKAKDIFDTGLAGAVKDRSILS